MPLLDTVLGWDVLPDSLIRLGIRRLLRQRLRDERADDPGERRRRVDAFADELRRLPVAVATKAANDQHYEVPASFYRLCLGPRLKYSSCLYPKGDEDIPEFGDVVLRHVTPRSRLEQRRREEWERIRQSGKVIAVREPWVPRVVAGGR